MESNVEVALASKLLLLFPPTDETYLAFPLSGVAFTLEDLKIFESVNESAADIRLRYHRKAQFARMLNQIPYDSLLYESQDRLLWKEYEQVLECAQMANSSLTKKDHMRLWEARNYLSNEVKIEDSVTTVYSAELKAYYQYKETYESAERQYMDEKITAEAVADPEFAALWKSQREPQLRQARDRVKQDWIILGNKEQVESAQATVLALTNKSPQTKRAELLRDLEACRELDLVANDPNGVFSTFYSPSKVFDPAVVWTQLHLTKDEISTLIAKAPIALRARRSATVDDIKSVTLEYASVTVIRPWFDAGFFGTRSWRLPADETTVVSDGKNPNSGRMPAFITNMIVARKFSIERSLRAGVPRDHKARMKNLDFLACGIANVDQRWHIGAAATVEIKAAPHPEKEPDAAKLRAFSPRIERLENRVVKLKEQGTTITQAPLEPSGVAIIRDSHTPSRSKPTQPIKSPPRRTEPKPPHPAGATPNSHIDEVVLDGAIVLAYRCRRVPASPSPDETLDW